MEKAADAENAQTLLEAPQGIFPERVWAAPLSPPPRSPKTVLSPLRQFLQRFVIGDPQNFSFHFTTYRHPARGDFSPTQAAMRGPGGWTDHLARWTRRLLVCWLISVLLFFSPVVIVLGWILAVTLGFGLCFSLPIVGIIWGIRKLVRR